MAKRKVEEKPVEEVEGPNGVAVGRLPETYDFRRSVQLWVGPPKVGKTSTAAMLGRVAKKHGIGGIEPFFLLFESGSGGTELDACTVEKCPCGGKSKECIDCGGVGRRRLILTDLDAVDKWVEWAAQSKFNPIVIDTLDRMYLVIADKVCVELGVPDPTQSDHGVAWVMIFITGRAVSPRRYSRRCSIGC